LQYERTVAEICAAINKNASVNYDVTSGFDVVRKILLKLTVRDIRHLCERLSTFYNVQPGEP